MTSEEAIAEDRERAIRIRRARMAMSPEKRRAYRALRREIYDLSTKAQGMGVYLECFCDTGMKYIFVNNIGRTHLNSFITKGNGKLVLAELAFIAGTYGLPVRLEYEPALAEYYQDIGFRPVRTTAGGITIAEIGRPIPEILSGTH